MKRRSFIKAVGLFLISPLAFCGDTKTDSPSIGGMGNSTPYIIAPDDFASRKRWVLQNTYLQGWKPRNLKNPFFKGEFGQWNGVRIFTHAKIT